MRSLLLAALLAVPALRARAEDTGIQRYLHHLQLGDSLKDVQRIYPPSQDWPSYREPRGRVDRYRVERAFLRKPDPRVETLWLGMKRNRLLEIQLIYDAEYSRKRNAEEVAKDWSLIYGEPQRTEDGRYYWTDGSTVLRVFNAEVPVLKDKGTVVELRTSVQLFDAGLFERID